MTRITQELYDRIKTLLPVQRGNVRVPNVDFLNAILHIAESGCKWRQLPKEFGDWHTIYVRMQRWVDKGVWPRVQEALKSECDISLDITVLLRGSTGADEWRYGKERHINTAQASSAETAAVNSVVYPIPHGQAANEWRNEQDAGSKSSDKQRHENGGRNLCDNKSDERTESCEQ